MLSLCCQYMPLAEIQRIVGGPAEAITQEAVKYDVNASFNVSELDNDLVKQRLETISAQIVPLDTAGVIDRSKLIPMILRGVAPEAADELLVDKQGAAQAIYKGVQSDIALMLLGFEAQYVENDPTAGMKMQFAQQIVQSNPAIPVMAEKNPMFQPLFQNYVKNLEMSVMQQQNKQVGRLGVKQQTTQQAPGPAGV